MYRKREERLLGKNRGLTLAMEKEIKKNIEDYQILGKKYSEIVKEKDATESYY